MKQQLPALQAALSSYSAGGKNEKQGEDAARAVIVPPIALMFSLMGALTHLAKLLYLLLVPVTAAILTRRSSRAVQLVNRHPLVFPVVLISALLVMFSVMNNNLTGSKAYQDLKHAMQGAQISITDEPLALRGETLLRVVHAVSIGQSYSYPMNQYLRVTLLRGFNFGYVAHDASDAGE